MDGSGKSSFLKLKKVSRKGQGGTVLIIGGSELYTGAPLFAAKAALRAGADLVYIFCKKKAIPSIKVLTEAIVSPIIYDERILKKITACVVGPGLGRISRGTLSTIVECLKLLNARNVPIVLDADAIHYYKRNVFYFLKHCVITPNYKESKNLDVAPEHTCLYKDKIDTITHNGTKVIVYEQGCPKRCGGQGDILTGVLASALYLCPQDCPVHAVYDACNLVRKAARRAFQEKGYGVIASDIIESLPLCLMDIFKSSTSQLSMA